MGAEVERGAKSPARATPVELTTAEVAVLLYLPTRLSTAEIALRRRVSRNAVKVHVESICQKLAVATRSEAVDTARQLGLLPAEAHVSWATPVPSIPHPQPHRRRIGTRRHSQVVRHLAGRADAHGRRMHGARRPAPRLSIQRSF